MAKSPRMVPGAEARGLVAPRMAIIIGQRLLKLDESAMKLTAAGLDDVTALPDHGDNGAAQHVCFNFSHTHSALY